MADTTSNEGRMIATKGSLHIFQATQPCVNLVPPMPGKPQPFDNFVPSLRLQKGKTTKTFIGRQPIVTSAGEIGPDSEPHHEGIIGGVNNGHLYVKEAQASTYSKNVFAEEKPVVRTDDLTWQNHKNTVGIVDGSAYKKGKNAGQYELDSKCTITKFEGTDGKRKLGYPGKQQPGEEPSYLEVLVTDTVKFTTERYDITKDPNAKNPTCLYGPHTKWTAKVKDSAPVPHVGEEFTVDASMAHGLVMKTLLGKPLIGFGFTGSGGNEAVGMIYEAIMYFAFKSTPPTIDVEALACAGPKNAILKVFPAKKLSFEISIDGDKGEGAEGSAKKPLAIESSFQSVKKVCDFARKLAAFMGGELKLEYLVGAKLELEAQFKKCEEEKKSFFGDDMLSPARVGLNWVLTFSASPLVGLKGKIKKSLMEAAVPLAGQWLAQAARWARLPNCDFVLSASIECSLSATIGRDQYDYPSNNGGKFGVEVSISGAVEAGTAGWAVVEAKLQVKCDASVSLMAADKPKVLMQWQLEGGIATTFSITLFKDSWYKMEGKWKIPWGTHRFEGDRHDIWTTP